MRRRPQRGQALVETAMVMPIILLILLGASDLSRAFIRNIQLTAASRAGMRTALNFGNADLGRAVRNELDPLVTNDDVTWGDTGPTGARSCVNRSACGDPQGCPPSAFTGGRLACFAVRPCNISGTLASPTFQQCTSPSPWGGVAASGQAIEVRVVYAFAPATPMIAQWGGPGGRFYLGASTIGAVLF
jgi:hypothetical protein